MNSAHQESEEWFPCEAGLLQACRAQALQQRSRARRVRAATWSVTAGLLLAVTFSGMWFMSNRTSGMACAEVQSQVDSYLAMDLPAGQRRMVEEHIAGCPECRRFYAARAAELGLSLGQPVAGHGPSRLRPSVLASLPPVLP